MRPWDHYAFAVVFAVTLFRWWKPIGRKGTNLLQQKRHAAASNDSFVIFFLNFPPDNVLSRFSSFVSNFLVTSVRLVDATLLPAKSLTKSRTSPFGSKIFPLIPWLLLPLLLALDAPHTLDTFKPARNTSSGIRISAGPSFAGGETRKQRNAFQRWSPKKRLQQQWNVRCLDAVC